MDNYSNDNTAVLWNLFKESVLNKSPMQFENFHNYFVSKYEMCENSIEEVEENVA